MEKEFSDYNGPTGLFVATGEQMLPLDQPEALQALGQAGMLTSLGSSPKADEYEQLIAS